MDTHSLKILHVEDNLGDACLVREMLRATRPTAPVPWLVVQVTRLQDALAAVAAEQFDLVLCDLSLPDAQGLETVHQIRQVAPELAVVMLSGLDDEQLAVQAVQAGAQDYLLKGHVDEYTLPRAICYAIERKRAEAEIHRLNAALEQRVTERTAQLEAAVQEIADISYTISHDMHAPLRAVDGFSRLLLDAYGPQLAPEAQGYLQRVRTNAQHMGQLIDSLLTFLRLSRQPLQKRNVAPADSIRQALHALHIEQEGHRVEITMAPLVPCEADPSLLTQVWMHLLSNAIKFTRTREHAVIDIGCRNDMSTCLYFIKDNGVGFEMQYVQKLFGMFQRLHRVDEYEGLGIGLAICRKIIERHGGRIWAEGRLGAGATFSFTLPTTGQTTIE